MKLLIVDDEILAIQGLLDDIPWDRLHYDTILTANSYAQAVNIFMSHQIDVMLCDIEMPYGSGLDLVKWVKAHYEKTICIFLTCHDDFSFARQAIKLQCLGYILKPADTEEVVEYLVQAAKKVQKDNKLEIYCEYGEVYVNNIANEARAIGSKDVLEEVEKYIHTHIADDLPLEQLAGIANVSLTHMGRLFKKKHNLSTVDYITRVRMELARELLTCKDLTVSAIAAKTGYNSYSYFTKTFTRYYGMPPRDYRKKVKSL